MARLPKGRWQSESEGLPWKMHEMQRMLRMLQMQRPQLLYWRQVAALGVHGVRWMRDVQDGTRRGGEESSDA